MCVCVCIIENENISKNLKAGILFPHYDLYKINYSKFIFRRSHITFFIRIILTRLSKLLRSSISFVLHVNNSEFKIL